MNPYQSPVQSPPPPIPVASGKPAALTAFGILNLLFGSLGLISGALSFYLYFTPLEHQTGPMADLLRADPFYASFMRVLLIPGTVFVVLQIVSGIGLLQGREGARRIALGCAVYGIVAGLVAGYLTYVHVLPFTTEIALKGMKDPAVAGMTRNVTKFASLVGLLGGMIYPVLTLVFLRRPKVRDFCLRRAASKTRQETLG